ncbi:uncharacterized protein [Diabrotica undecimpunctata]|uniref:uncharacterized protein n=1 Tax=Diabrotica undecimpunctata TaxID=50387 RepID=UPI003B6380C0
MNRYSRKRPSVPGSSLVSNQGSGRTHGQRAEGAKNPRVVGGYQERPRLHIITYNVRTLSKDEKMTEEELKHVKWDIIEISEVKRRGEYQVKLKSRNIFHYKGETESTTGGIGLFVYAPTSDYEDEIAEAFYEEIERAKKQEPAHYNLIMGDFNEKLGRKKDEQEVAIEDFGIGRCPSDLLLRQKS